MRTSASSCWFRAASGLLLRCSHAAGRRKLRGKFRLGKHRRRGGSSRRFRKVGPQLHRQRGPNRPQGSGRHKRAVFCLRGQPLRLTRPAEAGGETGGGTAPAVLTAGRAGGTWYSGERRLRKAG